MLLPLSISRNMGSILLVEDLHKLGHLFSYTEATFIENKWIELREKKSKLVPTNIKQNIIVTHMTKNIDYESKNHKRKETHNSNSILLEQSVENNKSHTV